MGINKLQHTRLIFIDRMIRKGNYPNATSLADEYEVTTRTILRDIEYMRDSLSAPIEFDRSHNGYYYSEHNFFLPALDIKESDFFAICITEKALQQYHNTPLYDQLEGIFTKLKQYLPESIRVNTSWIDTRYTFMHESFTRIDASIWETVSNSLRLTRQLEMIHLKAGAEKAVKRIVDPYHIVNFRGEWYLVAFCHKRGEVIRFAMSRIKSATLLNSPYTIPADFDFNNFIGSGFGIMTEETEEAVSICFAKEQAPYIIERQWHRDQSIEENSDGSVILKFTTNSLFEVKRWVLSWGPGAEVLSPASLRKQVAEEATALCALYEKKNR